MQKRPDLSTLTGKAFPVQASQNPGITQKINGSVKAQVMCPGGRFPYQNKRRQVGPLHASHPARCACKAHGRCPHPAAQLCSNQHWLLLSKAGAEMVKPAFCNQILSLKHTCISEDESAARRLNVLCASPCPAVKPSWGVMSTQHQPPQFRQLRQNRWRCPAWAPVTALALDIKCMSNLLINSAWKQPGDMFFHWKHISS